eukprot:COSAG02_NODE_75265_length_147_cov_133.291667_1_plen_39_part_10
MPLEKHEIDSLISSLAPYEKHIFALFKSFYIVYVILMMV